MSFESIQEMFGRAADNFSGSIAIDRSDRTLTYRELEVGANRLANFLISAGAAKGSVVAIFAEDTFEIVTAIIGTLRAGCVFAPLSPAIPETRLRAMIAEISPSWFITETAYLSSLSQVANGSSKVICLDGDEYRAHSNTDRPAMQYGPDDMCYLYFTSGSTGRPKAIAGRLKAIGHFIKWETETLGFIERPRVSQLTAPSFDAYLRDIFFPLCSGGTVCVPDKTTSILETAKLVDWLDRKQIDVVHCVPSLFRTILNAQLTPDHFSHLKYVLLAGERLLSADVKRWMKVFGERIKLVNLYGPSETTMTKLFYSVQPGDQERSSIPIGKPISGCRTIVLDEKQRECPTGTVGEIYIRTPFRTLGYYNQPELTRQSFIPNPFNTDPNDLIYKTGDLGCVLEDGNLAFLGRKDLQVKINGVRIELSEIEDLLRDADGIADVVVADREDEVGNKYLCAYVVTDKPIDSAALKRFLSNHLPDFMVPSVFVKMDALPRTISGKIDRRALPAPARTQSESRAQSTAIEEILSGIWCDVLNVKRVAVDENFFELGGYSLLVALLLSRVQRAFKVELPLRAVFQAPTVRGMAEVIQSLLEDGKDTQKPPLISRGTSDKAQLSLVQEGLWFLTQLEPDSYAYNIPAAVRVRGEIDPVALQTALTKVEERHESLRTTFAVESGRPVQRIAPHTTLRISVRDLKSESEEHQEAEIGRICLEGPRQVLDLTRGPLFRLTLLSLSNHDHVILITMHHIISDAWSIDLLIRELIASYVAICAGQEPELPKLSVQYADYAAWQREHLDGDRLESQLTYWKQQLSQCPELKLPVDRPRLNEQTYTGGLLSFDFDEALKQQIVHLARREESTLYMTLLAVYCVMLHYYSNQEDFAVGSPVANRTSIEVEKLIGMFSNTVVLRADLSGNPSFSAFLERVRTVVLAAFAHQDVPFNKIVEALKPKRGPNVPNLFQVSFNLIQTPAGGIVEQAHEHGLELIPLSVDAGMLPFDLVLSFRYTENGLKGFFTYNTDLFDDTTISAMSGHFRAILETVIATPDISLGEIRTMLAGNSSLDLDIENELKKLQLQNNTFRKPFSIPQPAA